MVYYKIHFPSEKLCVIEKLLVLGKLRKCKNDLLFSSFLKTECNDIEKK